MINVKLHLIIFNKDLELKLLLSKVVWKTNKWELLKESLAKEKAIKQKNVVGKSFLIIINWKVLNIWCLFLNINFNLHHNSRKPFYLILIYQLNTWQIKHFDNILKLNILSKEV